MSGAREEIIDLKLFCTVVLVIESFHPVPSSTIVRHYMQYKSFPRYSSDSKCSAQPKSNNPFKLGVACIPLKLQAQSVK